MRNDLAHERYIVEVDGIGESRISNFRERTESQLAAKARASELPRQTARAGDETVTNLRRFRQSSAN